MVDINREFKTLFFNWQNNNGWFTIKVRKVRKIRKVMHRMKSIDNNRFAISVKVGPKGQITIPVEARKMFDIKEGDSLIVLGDKTRGIALVKADQIYDILDGVK